VPNRLARIFWSPPQHALVADATVLTSPQEVSNRIQNGTSGGAYWSKYNTSPQPWQEEAWGFFDTLGMFRNAVGWKAGMVGRVRLRAALKEPGNDEPTIQDSGAAADIVASISAGTQMQIMGNLETQLSVPGDGYLVGVQTGATITETEWEARSKSELRYQPTSSSNGSAVSDWEIVDKTSPANALQWIRLPKDTMVVRVHRPHARFKHLADANARPALTTMRQVELIQRYLQAHFLSRIASNGVVVFPQEVSFPVREEFAEMDDAFVREFIETGVEAIKTPGSAAAAMPMPITVPGEYADKVNHVDFTSKFDLRIIEKWDKAVGQLAIDLDIPPEALTGMASANHWTGWLIDENGFKVYLAPDVEIICDALTKGLLHPMLQALKQPIENVVMWYDASEIIQRPDRSQSAKDVYDKLELSGEALRRETGFDEDDKPTTEELHDQLLLKLSGLVPTAAAAFEQITGEQLQPQVRETISESVAPGEPGAAPAAPTPQEGPPNQGKPPATPDQSKAAPAEQAAAAQLRGLRNEWEALERMATLPHAMRLNGLGKWQVLHPAECTDRVNACPVTFAQWLHPHPLGPGTTGVYECLLDEGRLRLGHPLNDTDVADMLPTVSRA
jgi:hypothetical protein